MRTSGRTRLQRRERRRRRRRRPMSERGIGGQVTYRVEVAAKEGEEEEGVDKGKVVV